VSESHVFARTLGRTLPWADRAEGALIWDRSGKRYIDAAGGAVVVGVGHGDPGVVEALSNQARRLAYAHGTQFTTEAVERYAAELAKVLPLGSARVYPVSGGSEGVETALKLARAYHLARGEGERHRIVARAGSYHGNSLGALDASGRAPLRRPYLPWLGRAIHVDAPYEYRCSLPDHPHGCGRRLADLLDAAIVRAGPRSVACFIAEPIIGATLGAAVPPDDYWGPVREVCSHHGVLLIADEVMTGFGRTGAWFASHHWDLEPDIVVAAKGASSGYWPLGFAACSQEVFDAVATTGFIHGFTYSHSAVGAAVGLAVLERLRGGDLVAASATKGAWLKDRLRRALGGHPHVGDIRGRGLMIGLELVEDRVTKAPFARAEKVTERLVAAAAGSGLLLYPSTGCADGSNGDLVMMGPPFVISEAEMTEAVAILTDVLDALPLAART
jgi:adenosylmethionine-8-amino-7-oxononanoate aminotransferase